MNILEVARNRQSSLVLEPLTGSQFMVWGFRGCAGFDPRAGPSSSIRDGRNTILGLGMQERSQPLKIEGLGMGLGLWVKASS